MHAIIKTFINAFTLADQRNWDKIYVAVDVHGTICPPTWNKDLLDLSYYSIAKYVLQIMTKRSDIELILYTSSHPEEIEKYLAFFENDGIKFNYVNENPEVKTSNGYGNYDKKFYFNVLLDDRAGFDPYNDWVEIQQFLKNYPIVIKHYN